MLNTPLSLRALYTRILKNFSDLRGQTPVFYQRITTTVPSTVAFETYAWMGAFPRMREWIGARHVKGITERLFVIRNKSYELTIGIDRDQVDDGQMAYVQFILEGIARETNRLPNDLIIDLMQNGQAIVGYDGQFFYDTDHPANLDAITGTQRNYYASGQALTAPNYAARRAEMMSYQSEDGRPIGVLPNLLIVPPQLEDAARQILNSDFIVDTFGSNTAAAARTNTYKGSAELLVVPEIGNQATTWYLVDTSDGLKPFVLQERTAPRIVPKQSLTDENVFWNKEYLFGADARYGAGPGAWFRTMKCAA